MNEVEELGEGEVGVGQRQTLCLNLLSAKSRISRLGFTEIDKLSMLSTRN